jgi:hypothetical protein
MVTWIKDATGRFAQRPFYAEDELEDRCDAVIASHYDRRGLSLSYPIPTNELVILLETMATTVDIYSELDNGVEGRTDFRADGSILVQIAGQLGEDEHREHRLRTTLTHELAHIVFHSALFRADGGTTATCHRGQMLDAPSIDWLEWQAGFASTAMLMPRGVIAKLIADLGLSKPLAMGSVHGRQLIGMVTAQFLVSREAAGIRLQRLGHVVDQTR